MLLYIPDLLKLRLGDRWLAVLDGETGWRTAFST
jgi:hypothetical protein